MEPKPSSPMAGFRALNSSGCALPSWPACSRFPSSMAIPPSVLSRPARQTLRGRTVFTLHPHQTLFDVPEAAAIPVPANVPAGRAVLAANMETRAERRLGCGSRTARKGGCRGSRRGRQLTGLLLRQLSSANVTLVDINPARATVASAFGLDFATPEQAPSECELIVHASASSAGLATALSLARRRGTILELSWYGNADVSVPLGGAFHSRRLRIVASQVGMIAPSHRKTWTHRRRLEKALSLLADDRLDVLLEAPVAFADLPARLPGILRSRKRHPVPTYRLSLRRVPVYAVEVRDHIMIAHSFKGAVFGPAQALHGATFVVDAAIMADTLDENGIVVDIGRAHEVLKAVLEPLNYKNLDTIPELAGKNTTTEFLTRHVYDRLAEAARDGKLGRRAGI